MSRIETREHVMMFLFQASFRTDPVAGQLEMFKEDYPEVNEDPVYFVDMVYGVINRRAEIDEIALHIGTGGGECGSVERNLDRAGAPLKRRSLGDCCRRDGNECDEFLHGFSDCFWGGNLLDEGHRSRGARGDEPEALSNSDRHVGKVGRVFQNPL